MSNENFAWITSFKGLLTKKENDNTIVDQIIIPKIQRDYAQGRADNKTKKIRDRFVESLFSALQDDDSKVEELDFIYGERQESDPGMRASKWWFNPLDGQQRLTTLFLLHWYISKRAQVPDAECSFLANFTYDTRESSNLFCAELTRPDYHPEFSLPIDEMIKDENWFPESWKDDPTIASMLTMLRTIDDKYCDMNQDEMKAIWRRLTEPGKEKILFHCLLVGEMGLTDSIYVKMNSRGKQLTNFEHFKAELEKSITVLENAVKGYEEDQYDEIGEYAQSFSRKIDTSWTDLMWSYRNKRYDQDKAKYMSNGVDQMLLGLIAKYFSILCYRIPEYASYVEIDPIEQIPILLDKSKPEESLAKVKDLETIFDFFCHNKSIFADFLTNKECDAQLVSIGNDLPSGSIDYLQFCGGNISVRNLIMLYAFFLLAIHESEIRSVFAERIRVLRNLAWNSSDSLREANIPTILEQVENLIVYGNLEFGEGIGFNGLQIKQEKEKREWLKYHPADRETILRIENHRLLNGNLSPVFAVWDNSVNVQNAEKFLKVFKPGCNLELIETAMLSTGDYAYRNRWRTIFGGKQEQLWREELFVHGNQSTQPVLSLLFDKLENCSDEELNSIVNSFLEKERATYDWRYYLVRHRGMRAGDSGVYWWRDWNTPYDIIMMGTAKSLRGYHWNPFLFALSKKIDGSKIQNFNSPLSLPGEKYSLKCFNSMYELESESDKIQFYIPQKNGVDTVDRIDWILAQLKESGYIQ